jgi:hypothetical protein
LLHGWIAIAGSIDMSRSDLSISRPEIATESAKQIGRALADKGFGIVVYSSDAEFIERHVVAGYVSSDNVQPESIWVIYPRGSVQPVFPEQKQRPTAFRFKLDQDLNWEVSFYRSVYNCDGMLLIGGGQSTLVAGVLCVTRGIPLVCLEGYGGAGSKVWGLLSPSEQRITDEEKTLMGEVNDSFEWAAKVVASIDAQRERIDSAKRLLERQGKARWRGTLLQGFVSVIALGSALVLFVVTWDANLSRSVLLTALVAAPALAGTSGSMLRAVWETLAVPNRPLTQSAALVALLGSAAGTISGLLYVVAQLTALVPGAHGELPSVAGRLVPFALLTGFLAGFATDAFFRKLQDREVSTVDVPTFKTHQ